MAIGDDNIKIDVSPDLTGFGAELRRKLESLTSIDVKVDVKPNVSGFKTELKTKLEATNLSVSVPIDIKIPKQSFTDAKADLKKGLQQEFKVGPETYHLPLAVNIDAQFTDRSLRALRTDVNNVFKKEETNAQGKPKKVSVPVALTAEFTPGSLRKLKTDVNNVFKRTVTQNGVTRKETAAIALKAEFTKGSLAGLRKSANDAFKRNITDEFGRKSKVAIPIKLKTELDHPSRQNIAALKTKILRDFGVVRLPVVAVQGVNQVGSLKQAATGAANASVTKSIQQQSYAQRNLARDITLVGRAATQSKASMFSFLGAISPAQVAITATSTALISGTRAFIKYGLESAKSVQQTNLALQGFLGGNRPLIDAFINQMQDFAAVTPFNLEGILKTSKLLLGAGQNVTKILPELKAIGGVGAQLGVGSVQIERVGTAIAKIAGQGKVTSRELRTIFTAFPGFQPIKALADNLEGFGGSTQKVLKAMSKGAVDANSAIDALIKGMEQYPGAAEALYKQSLLLAGSQETLIDRFQQLARATLNNSLPQLALSYREAAKVFDEQSKTGIGSGIRALIRNGSELIPVIARGVVPVIDAFSGAMAELIPGIKEGASAFGGAFFESLKAVLKLAPALGQSLTAFVSIITPFAPVIETVAKAIQLIPAPLIAAAGAFKLFNSVSGKFGLFGRGGLSSIGPPIPKELQKGGLLAGLARESSSLRSQISKDFVAITGVAQASTKKLQSFSTKINAKAYSKYVDDTIAAESKRINKLVVGDITEQKILADRGRNYARFISGPGGLEDLSKRASIFQADKNFKISQDFSKTSGGLDSIRKSLAGVTQESIPFRTKFTSAASLVGTAMKEKVGGALTAVSSQAKQAGSSLLSAFGGPAGLAITAATIGITALIGHYQKASAEAKQVKQETSLIGKELALDSSAINGAERLGEIIHRIATESEFGAAAVRKLTEGVSSLSSKGLTGQTAADIEAIKVGASESQISAIFGDLKRTQALQKTLRDQANGLEGTGFVGGGSAAFGRFTSSIINKNNPQLAAQRALTATRKITEEYLQSSKNAVAEELKIATDLKDKGLVATFKKAQKDLENGKDPAKVYDRIRGSVNELAIKQSTLNDSAIKAALSGKALSSSMLASADATQAANDATDELNTSLNELILNQDSISADTLSKVIGQKNFGALSTQFAGLAGDPQAQVDFLKDVNAKMLELSNDPTVAKALTAQIAGWKQATTAALVDFKDAFKSSLPNLTTIFAEEFDLSNKGPGLQQITSRLKNSTDYILKFQKNLNILYSKGFQETAILFAQQGPAAAGKALDQAVASIGKNGSSKALTSLEKNLKVYETTIDNSGTAIEQVAKAAIGKQFNISPDLIVTPTLTINEITPEAKEAAAKQIAGDIDKIDARRKALTAENRILKRKGEGFNIEERLKNDPLLADLFPAEPTEAEITALTTRQLVLQDKVKAKVAALRAARSKVNKGLKSRGEKSLGYNNIYDDAEYKNLLFEQDKLTAYLKNAKDQIFTNVQDSATKTAAAVTQTFSSLDIKSAVAPQVAEVKSQIASIATGSDSLGSQIAINFAPSLLNANGSKSVVFKNNSAFDLKAILGSVLETTGKAAGTLAGEAMAKAFKDSFKASAQITGAEATALSTGILKPFRTARLGINSLITALTAMGSSLGVSLTLAQIPEFHTGGVVGSRAKMHSGRFNDEEQLAVLLKGEAVLPHKTVNQMSPAMIKSLVKGDVDGFIPQYLNSKAYGGTNAVPSQEASASFRPTLWNEQFDKIRRSVDAQMAQTKRQLVNLAFETFDTAYDMSKTYTGRFGANEGGNFGTVASIAALTGSLKQIVAKMEAEKGKDNNYRTLIAYMKSSGVPFNVSSTLRPGAITNAGGKSYHSFGRAVDFTGLKYGVDSPQLGNIFKAFNPVESLLAELIYSGPQTRYNIKNGKRVGKYAVADHHNHVHAALYNGGLVQGSADGIIANIGERGQSEMVLPMNSPARIMDLTTEAIRSQMLGVEGQQAMLMALVGSAANQKPSMVHHGNNVGDVKVYVESPSADPRLEGEIIGMRVRAALRRKL